ncbi:hypothetical protein [Paraburkholderia oxyphila]|uniref:hypothetical protein n=1 Tax=Paraburkholderia oxyphila TaxID=614212 RepID=UPI0012ED6F4F|nr:hypothetical protein [Paraburkholderia oxyphila]
MDIFPDSDRYRRILPLGMVIILDPAQEASGIESTGRAWRSRKKLGNLFTIGHYSWRFGKLYRVRPAARHQCKSKNVLRVKTHARTEKNRKEMALRRRIFMHRRSYPPGHIMISFTHQTLPFHGTATRSI